MDLSKTIAELEKQAAQYTAAADSLRALNTGSSAAAVVAAASAPSGAKRGRKPGRPAGSKASAAKAAKGANGKRYVSPETRAKIAAAIKARHDEKRRAREGN